jgi:hypothetical protein
LCGGERVVKNMRVFLQRLKTWWEGYLGRMAKANKESFGGGKMDCCGLGKAAGNRKHG